MSTFTDKSIIVEMLKNDGVYFGDPQVDAIYEYTNRGNGKVMWKVIYDRELQLAEFVLSPYVSMVVRLWDKDQGLSPYGRHVSEEK